MKWQARVLPLILVLSLAASMLPAAEAAEDTSDTGVLYLTGNVVNESMSLGCGTLATYDMTSTPPSSAAGQTVYPGFSAGGVACPFYFQYTAPHAIAFQGNAELVMYVGCQVASYIQGIEATLSIGSEETGSDSSSSLLAPASYHVCTPTTDAIELTFTLPTNDLVLEAGKNLLIQIYNFEFTPSPVYEAGTGNTHFKVFSTDYPAALRNPGIIPPGAPLPDIPKTHLQDLSNQTAEVYQNHTNNTSDIYIFNWTSQSGSLDLEYDVQATNGSVQIILRDGANQTAFDATITDSFANTIALDDLEPGNWTITLDYDNFAGIVNLTGTPVVRDTPPPFNYDPCPSADPDPPAETEETGTHEPNGTPPEGSATNPALMATANNQDETNTSSTSSDDENECPPPAIPTPSNGDEPTQRGKESPGLGFMLLIAALGLAAIATRPRK